MELLLIFIIGLLTGWIIGWVSYASIMFQESQKDIDSTITELLNEVAIIRKGGYVK